MGGGSGTQYQVLKASSTDTSSHSLISPSTTATNQSATATNNATTATNQNTGGSQAHNNMPPYLAVYVWKRTA